MISQLAEASPPSGTVPRDYLILVELRTMPQGHPDYRVIAQEM
ncbi:MAG TPA: hypothetical protein VJ646_20950 [Candidatus Binatia bacterium]|nr:hypothetical protein [Candidatus Binatia bacterium]